MPSTCSEYQWILMNRDFFGFDKDLYVCFGYIPPQYSSYYIDQGNTFFKWLNQIFQNTKTWGL